MVSLIDSVGVPDSRTVGGFIYYPYTSADWTPYLSPITGTHYGRIWNARILWGAGSIPAHSHDAHNFGIWKPLGSTDSTSFFTHSPSTPVWVEGNGCSAVLHDTTDPIDVFNTIKDVAQKISSGYWPTDKFYSMSVMINQRNFSAGFVTKVNRLLDSINTLVAANMVEWATINEKFDTFQAWSTVTSRTHSMWTCEDVPLATAAQAKPGAPLLYPNPARDVLYIDNANNVDYSIAAIDGIIMQKGNSTANGVNITNLPPGFYIINISTEGAITRLRFTHW